MRAPVNNQEVTVIIVSSLFTAMNSTSNDFGFLWAEQTFTSCSPPTQSHICSPFVNFSSAFPTTIHRMASKEPGALWASDQVDLFGLQQTTN